MEQVKCHCVYKEDIKMFQLTMSSEGGRSFKVNLTWDQFFGMVQYLGKVAVSYQQWIGEGGK